MPVKTIQPDGTLVRVCSNCGAEHTHAPGSVKLGRTVEDVRLPTGKRHEPKVVLFPPCTCGAQENFCMAEDTIPDQHRGTPFDKRRRAVNAYCMKLRELGHIDEDPDGAAEVAKLREPPDRADLSQGVQVPTPPRARRGARGGRP